LTGWVLHQVLIQFYGISCFIENFVAFGALVTRKDRLHRDAQQQGEKPPARVLVFSNHQRMVTIVPARTFLEVFHFSTLLNFRLHSKNFSDWEKRLRERLRLVEQPLHVFAQSAGEILNSGFAVAAVLGDEF